MEGQLETIGRKTEIMPGKHELTAHIEWSPEHGPDEVESLRQRLERMAAEQGMADVAVELSVEHAEGGEALQLRCFVVIERTDIFAADNLMQAITRALPTVGPVLIADVAMRDANEVLLRQMGVDQAAETARAVTQRARQHRPPSVQIGPHVTRLVTHEE